MSEYEMEKFEESLKEKIYSIRGYQVMLDRDLAELYGVETRRVNEQVKRNKGRFPESFCFMLTIDEFENLMSQFAISSWGGNLETKQSGLSLKLIETDKRVDKIFSLMESGEIKPKQGKLFDKQVFDNSHDRFIVIDEKVIYHFGASLKDPGKKWFGFSKMDVEAIEMLSRLNK